MADDSRNNPFAASKSPDKDPAADESTGAAAASSGKQKRVPAELIQRMKSSIFIVDVVDSYGPCREGVLPVL